MQARASSPPREPTKRSRSAGNSGPTSPSTTHDADFAAAVLEATGNRGVDVVFDNVGEAVMDASMNCIAYNGRYLMMGFASNKEVADEKFVVPRRIALGNFKLCGVLLAYAQPDMAAMVKSAMGWNFASDELGARIMREIVELVRAGAVRAVVGEVVAFGDLPAAVEALANRATVGRTIVRIADFEA